MAKVSKKAKAKVSSNKPAKKKIAAKPKAKKEAAAKPKPKVAARKKAASSRKVVPAKKKTAPKAASKKQPVAKKSKAQAAAPKKSAKKAVIERAPVESIPAKPKAVKGKGKVLTRQFLMDVAQSIRDAVLPAIHNLKGREVASTSVSGDVTFELDKIAEKALLNHLKNARAPIAYYSEDAGYSTFSSDQPKNLLIVDPIDGTRAAKNGFEGCVIAIASTRVIERPTVADIDNACVVEIMGNRTFYAERGKGARMQVDGRAKRIKLSQNANLETISWSMTVPARPAELIFPTAARLIDLSSLKGGFSACNSTSFSLTRLLTGQLDACVDFASRYMKDIPDLVRDYFINAGRGAVLSIAPYDMAAALLIVQEAGCVVTNAYGGGFDDVLLLDSSEHNHQSIIAAANQELHEKLLSFFDTRIKQFEALLKRRA